MAPTEKERIMTRILTRSGVDHYMAAPPDELCAAPVGALLAELTRVRAELGRVGNEDAELRRNAHEHEHNARTADGAAAAEAARNGKPAGGTPNMDELIERRTRTAQQAAALADAVENIKRDLMTAKDTEIESGKPADKVAAARAKLIKAGELFTKALTEAVQARALLDWLNGMPYDPSAGVDVSVLAPAIGGSIGRNLLDAPPANSFDAITALVHLLDD
jgi:hypothetical protein